MKIPDSVNNALISYTSSIAVMAFARKNLRPNVYVVITGLLGIALMMFNAPDFRFGVTYCVMLISLVFANGANAYLSRQENVFKLFQRISPLFLSIVLSIFVSAHIYIIKRPSYKKLDKAAANNEIIIDDNLHFNFIYPPKIINIGYVDSADGKEHTSFNTENYLKGQVADVVYFRPEKGESCWNAPLPCAREELSGIKLRNPSLGIAGGFVSTEN